jgi:nucleoside 2-deoxyribosyltransferase
MKRDKSYRTDGTYIELGYAMSMEKEIIVFWDSMNLNAYSAMLKGTDSRGLKFYDIEDIETIIEVL